MRSYFKKMWKLALVPFILQAICMVFDEGYFHVRRGLPKWERIGHPIDTLSVIVCMSFVLFVPFSSISLKIYIALAIFSSILVTKDEFVHKHFCPASENWLHAILFTLHPITLTFAGLIWASLKGANMPSWMLFFSDNSPALHGFLYGQFFCMIFFFFYQVIFWNVLWKEKPTIKY